jgi:hypothetical protein
MSTPPIVDPVFEPALFEPDPRTAFGPILSAFEVEHALVACVRIWIRDYLAEMERQRGQAVEGMPWFRSIVVAGAPEKWPEDQLPALLVSSPGLAETGTRRGIEVHGDGGYVARYRVDAVCEVSARGNRQAIRLARVYAAAVRALLIQQPLRKPSNPPPWLRRVEWTGEDFTLRDWTVDRTRCAGRVSFVVEVADVMTRGLGPRQPYYQPAEPTEPPEPMLMPDVESTHVDVTKPLEVDSNATPRR